MSGADGKALDSPCTGSTDAASSQDAIDRWLDGGEGF